jgi:acyl-CoA synthetase (AMP-forming)/AMP-acid ligase II
MIAPAPEVAAAPAALSFAPERSWPMPRWREKLRVLFFGAGALRLATLPDRLATVYGDRPAFFLDEPLDYPFFRGSQLSFADLARLTARVAGALRRLGVRRGERVGLASRNRIEVAFAEFAAARLGAVVVPLNAMLRGEELRQLAADCDLRTLVLDRDVFEDSLGGERRLPGVERWVLVGSDAAPRGVHSLASLVHDADERFDDVPRRPDEIAAIFYTGGTTGRPKGALLSEGALLYAVRQQARLAAWIPTPRRPLALLVMPLAHTSGHQALLLQLVMGTPMLLHGRFSAQRVLEDIQRHRVTQFSGVPAMYRMLLDAGAEDYDLGSLEVLAWGGDAMPEEVRERFDTIVRRLRRSGPRWITGYGLAETAGQLTRAMGRALPRGVAGRPLRGVRVRIADAEGRPVRRGEVGELWVRSPGLMQGYLGDAEATRAVLRDGWFRTGDLAQRGARGRLFLASRIREMIKVGGYSVFPAEVEHALEAHPEVAQAAVVGVPHPVKGTVPAAAVVRKAGSALSEPELLAWARERIAPYKAPRHVVFSASIPLSAAMKPQRGEVARIVSAALAVAEAGGGLDREAT